MSAVFFLNFSQGIFFFVFNDLSSCWMDGWTDGCVVCLFNWLVDWWLAGWFIDYLFDWLTKPTRFRDCLDERKGFVSLWVTNSPYTSNISFFFTERAINPKTRKHVQVRLVRHFKENIHSSMFYVPLKTAKRGIQRYIDITNL